MLHQSRIFLEKKKDEKSKIKNIIKRYQIKKITYFLFDERIILLVYIL